MDRFRVTARQSGFIGAGIATCTLAALALLAPLVTQGQTPKAADSATLQGSVRDSKGRPVAAATVSLQGNDGRQILSVHSDPTGSYRFAGLGQGTYRLRVESAGFSAATFGPCVLGPKEAKTFDLVLKSSPGPQSQAPPESKAGAGTPEFYDEPQFTVAGVTDGTNLGGHGSNTIVRTKESLAKDIVSLSVAGDQGPSGSAPLAASTSAGPGESALRAALERQPADFEANRRLGKLLVENGKATESLAYLERASQIKPGDHENAYLLALAYADAGQYQRARTDARTLLTVRGQTQKDQAEVHQLLGDIEEKLGHPLEAVREYQSAAELNPVEPNFFDWGAELLLHRAVEPAIEVFSKGNRLFPHSPRMLIGLGVAWYSGGSYDRAAQRLCEASDLNPGDPKPYLFLGKMQSVETVQSECSTERLRRFVKLQPANAEAYYYYAVNLWKQRKAPDDTERLAQVETLLKKSVALDPRLGVGYLQLGVLYSERRDFSRAVSSYQEAIKANPQLEEAHYRLAQAFKQTGEKTKAKQELQLYNEISKKKEEDVERERRESQQFVYTLRSPAAGPPSP
jgi:tetratricopeptide (TPR) repeat protein